MAPKRKPTDLVANGSGGKRARLVKNEADDSSSSNNNNKRTTVDLDISDLIFSWERESDSGEMVAFSTEDIASLTRATQACKKQVTLTLQDKKIVIDLESMIEKSKDKPKLRCLVREKNSTEWFIWSWKDEDVENFYSAAHSVLLENAHNKQDFNFLLKLKTKTYTVDLENFTQTDAMKKEFNIIRKTEKCKPDSSNDVASTSKENIPSPVKAKKITTFGKPPVDPECTQKIGVAHVYKEADDVYDAMLSQTNLQFNNNKFYIIQLLEDNSKRAYSVWFRWGRVGRKGQNLLTDYGADLENAKSVFKDKFCNKTKNDWDERHAFEKIPGKYDLIQLDYSDVPDMKMDVEKPLTESQLDLRVKNLIEMICDVKAMEETVMEMKYDTKKAPLGKLTTAQIKAGYTALKEIDNLIKNNVTGRELLQACNDFYTRIPHDFGMKTPPLISDVQDVQQKLTLLEALGDIQVAIKLLNDDSNLSLHATDKHYKSLHCDLTPLERQDAEFKLIENYVSNTHGKTHSYYKLKVQNIFSCEKSNEAEEFKDYGNKMLLWHGSRLTNWVGILRKGLRIAPPEAPATGYMFGKGVYFADMCSKSANYCFATRAKNTGLLLLCEVSLGNCNKLKNANHMASKLPKGKHSVLGVGRVRPDPAMNVTLDDGTVIPSGRPCVVNAKEALKYCLNYNEYIVYDVSQIRMRYLVELKFSF